MRHVPLVPVFATLAGCPAPGGGVETGVELVPSVVLPEPGAPDTSTTNPPLPTSGAAATSGNSTTSGGTTTSGNSTTSATTSMDAAGGSTTSANSTGSFGPEEPWAPKPCPAIYAQELLPTFEIELGSKHLKAIKKEWSAADDDDLDEHPLAAFKYGDLVITNATIRLRGNSSHWPDQGKMQFEVSFNTNDKKGRFMGLKHLLFDAAQYNRSFLRDRLALAIMRDVGLPAPCANNVRIALNGKYYGLFTNIEKVASEFIARNFENPDGNRYKRSASGWEQKPNDAMHDDSATDALDAAKTVTDLLAVMNLEQAVLEWAAEAVIPNRDGAWAGGLNFYIYNDPNSGFNVIPWDLDDSFTRLPYDTDPIKFKKPKEVFWGRPFYDIVLDDPVWRDKYIAAIELVLKKGYDVAVLQGRIDAWAAQIATAVAEDPNKPFTTAEHLEKIQEKRALVAQRAAFLTTWLACAKDGGNNKNGQCKPK